MGILRYGDPYNNPDDRKDFNGISFELDMIVKSSQAAETRAEQLYQSGYYVIVETRDATPDEALEHLHTRDYLDGRATTVWDVWVSTGRRKNLRKSLKPKRRVQKSTKIKSKRKLKCKCK